MKFPVFDLHCDTALAILGDDLAGHISLKENDLHIDLNKTKNFSGYAQCFACFTTPQMEQWYGKSPTLVFERELAAILYQIESNADAICLAYSTNDIQKNLEKGRASAILTIEGPAGFGYDPALLEDLYKIGFRMTTLGWNESNPLAGSHITGEGLSAQGAAYVKQAQRLGMLVDVSHLSDQAFWDLMDITQAPIIASHSNSRTVCNVSRNLTDDMFRKICETGGVAGFNMYSAFVGASGDMEQAVRHFLHFLELDPTGRHIALGGDLDGCDTLIRGISSIADYPHLFDVLMAHGVDETIIKQITWENAMRVFQSAQSLRA